MVEEAEEAVVVEAAVAEGGGARLEQRQQFFQQCLRCRRVTTLRTPHLCTRGADIRTADTALDILVTVLGGVLDMARLVTVVLATGAIADE